VSDAGWWQTEENDEVGAGRKRWRPLADAMGGFDLDPAAGCEPTPIADERYTPADDGLTSPWFGTVWLNPPFSEKVPWFSRLVDQYRNGDVDAAVALSTVDPSCSWFHDHFATADVIGYPAERNLYLGAGDSPSFSTMVGVWNPTDAVVDTLRAMGTVVRPEYEEPNATLAEFGGDGA